MVAVNPEILKWARETAGLDMAEAATKIYADSQKSSAVDKMRALEAGQRELTQKQLVRLAKAYHQPQIVFYLPKPPRPDEPLEDLRTAPSEGFDRKAEAWLGLLIRDMRASQSIVRDLLEDEEAPVRDYLGSARLDMDPEQVGQDIAKRANFQLERFRSQRTVRGAFDYLRGCLESLGIFVLLMSDLGSDHTTIPAEVFRGFALADPVAPYIVINRQDAVSAWSFTALHEAAHLWLGKSALAGAFGASRTERFCNQVAAAILLPTHELRELPSIRAMPVDEAAALIGDFANQRNISRTMVAYGLLREDRISHQSWRQLAGSFKAEWLESQASAKARLRASPGGPNPHVVRRYNLGSGLLSLARYFVHGGELTPSKAGIVLGVRAGVVYPLLDPGYYDGRA